VTAVPTQMCTFYRSRQTVQTRCLMRLDANALLDDRERRAPRPLIICRVAPSVDSNHGRISALVVEDYPHVLRIAADQTPGFGEQHFHGPEFPRQRQPKTSHAADSGSDSTSYNLRCERSSCIAEAFPRDDQSVMAQRSVLPRASRTFQQSELALAFRRQRLNGLGFNLLGRRGWCRFRQAGIRWELRQRRLFAPGRQCSQNQNRRGYCESMRHGRIGHRRRRTQFDRREMASPQGIVYLHAGLTLPA
jgi:hypothetical protein